MNLQKNTILITGAAGFIGFHLTRELCRQGHAVHGLDNLNDYYEVSLKQDRLKELQEFRDSGLFTFVELDIGDREKLENYFIQNTFGIIIHLAAQAGVRYSIDHPHSYIYNNIQGFLNILEGCRHHQVQRLLYASSSSVYGGNTTLPFTEDQKTDRPFSLYGATKKSNELMAFSYSHLYGLNTTGLRFFTVYGPWGRPDMAYYKFTHKIIHGREIDVYNYGNHRRSFTYIDDIVKSIIQLLDAFPASLPGTMEKREDTPDEGQYQIFNIGGDRPESLPDFIGELEKNLGIKARINFLPMQPGDVKDTMADTRSLKTKIGSVPGTNIQDGLRKFVDWYRKYYNI